jgi:hypothetical protein
MADGQRCRQPAQLCVPVPTRAMLLLPQQYKDYCVIMTLLYNAIRNPNIISSNTAKRSKATLGACASIRPASIHINRVKTSAAFKDKLPCLREQQLSFTDLAESQACEHDWRHQTAVGGCSHWRASALSRGSGQRSIALIAPPPCAQYSQLRHAHNLTTH